MKSLNFKKVISFLFLLMIGKRLGAVNLHPDNLSLQTGGGMGIVSVGPGWKYGSCKRWETALFLGVIPQYEATSSRLTVAVKENFVPWKVKIKGRMTLEPMTASFYVTTVLDKKLWIRQPDRYPPGYYILPTKIRMNIAIGQRIGYSLPKKFQVGIISAFYEVGTCDIYALSAFGNKRLKPKDWLQLCIGVQFIFRK